MPHRTNLLCPRCGGQLYAGHTHNHVIHGCGHCGGVWLDAETSARVIDTACQATVQLAQQASQHGQAEVDTSTQHALACPTCQGTMRTTRVAKAWLDIDSCDAHGVWYDRGELERVARTAKIATSDWRQVQAPPVHGSQAATAMAVGAAGGGNQFGSGMRDDLATDIAYEVGAELAVEGLFCAHRSLLRLSRLAAESIGGRSRAKPAGGIVLVGLEPPGILEMRGEVTEWPKVHDWKSCVVQATAGSNPALSAKNAAAISVVPQHGCRVVTFARTCE